MYNAGVTGTDGLFGAAIFSDAGGAPGAQLGGGSPNLAAPNYPGGTVTALLPEPVLLQAGTSYWVVITAADSSSDVIWEIGGSSPVASLFYFGGEWSNADGLQSLQFAVDSAPGAVNCAYSLSPSGQVIPAAAGGGTVGVLTSAGCPWTAASASPFLAVTSGSSGIGPGTVQFSATANTAAAARAGTLIIGGQTATINQAGTAPLLELTPGSISVQWTQGSPLPAPIPLSIFLAGKPACLHRQRHVHRQLACGQSGVGRRTSHDSRHHQSKLTAARQLPGHGDRYRAGGESVVADLHGIAHGAGRRIAGVVRHNQELELLLCPGRPAGCAAGDSDRQLGGRDADVSGVRVHQCRRQLVVGDTGWSGRHTGDARSPHGHSESRLPGGGNLHWPDYHHGQHHGHHPRDTDHQRCAADDRTHRRRAHVHRGRRRRNRARAKLWHRQRGGGIDGLVGGEFCYRYRELAVGDPELRQHRRGIADGSAGDGRGESGQSHCRPSTAGRSRFSRPRQTIRPNMFRRF